MLEKGRISSIQYYMASIMIVLGTTILSLPSLLIQFGGRDAWLAPLVAFGPSLLVVLVMIQLNRFYPEQTPVEYLQTIFGKWLGSLLAAYMLWVLLRFLAVMTREAADFTITAALQRTPPEMVILLMLLVVMYVVRQGLEVIVRFAQFVVIIELIQLVASVLLLAIKDIDLSHLTPLFENGPVPILRSSFILSGWMGELMITGFLLPFIRIKKGTVKAAIGSVVTLTLLLVLSIFFTLGIFGDMIASRLLYGLYEVGRYISVAEFLERLDPIVMGTWIMQMFCKLTIFCYVTSLGLAQLLRLSDYRSMVTVVCLIVFTMSEQIFANQADMMEFFSAAYPPFGFLFLIIAPFLVFGVAALKKSVEKRKGEQHA